MNDARDACAARDAWEAREADRSQDVMDRTSEA